MPMMQTGAVNPLGLFTKEQGQKLAHTSPSGFMTATRKYFGGEDLMSIVAGTDEGLAITYGFNGIKREGAAAMRQVAGSIAGGYAAASVLGINPLEGLATLAGHGAIGLGALGMGGRTRLAGMAYLGATAVNTFRSGNNMGPM